MIGFLISGHGYFASGIYSACQLLGGEYDNVCTVDFSQDMQIDDLDSKLQAALETLKNCRGVIICCDLFGGTPFNRSMMKIESMNIPIYVVAGINLPVLLEALMNAKQYEGDLPSFVDRLMHAFQESFVNGNALLAHMIEDEEE